MASSRVVPAGVVGGSGSADIDSASSDIETGGYDGAAGGGAGLGAGAGATIVQVKGPADRVRRTIKNPAPSGGRISNFSTFSIRGFREPDSPMHQRIIKFIDGKVISTIMTIATIYALFGDDIRLAWVPPSVDPVFYTLSIIALVLFAMELILNSIAKRQYLWGFYFWLDLLATLSLIPDIGWFWDPLVGTGEDDATDASSGAIQAGKASRASTKAGRIVRIVRLVRLVRIVKLYKHALHKADEVKEMKAKAEQPSQVGKELSDLTTRRVIVIVLAMIIIAPFFDPNYLSGDENMYPEFALEDLHRQSFSISADMTEAAFKSSVLAYANKGGALLSMELNGYTGAQIDAWLNANNYASFDADGNFVTSATSPVTEWNPADLQSDADIKENFRSTELSRMSAVGCWTSAGALLQTPTNCTSRAVFSVKSTSQLAAMLNMGKTIFIMLVLALGAFMFTRDAEHLVIEPIERMVDLVKRLSKNPLSAVSDDTKGRKKATSYETALLETTLAKIGGLLQIGFGEAGTEIIRQNISKGGKLNAVIPGRKMTGIFGFCDIRQFTDATECLQEEVMVFVNRIGAIVHEATHQYWGAANKNIGDAFLLVWRVPDKNNASGRWGTGGSMHQITVRSASADEPKDTYEHITVPQLCDNAMYAFLKIMVDIENSNHDNDSEALGQYAHDHRIIARFGNEYKVRMGFGLHLGWAIEGAIGSRLKIDASYLSPNVNMAARLEAATKQYGVPLLMSDAFVDNLSGPARAYLRLLDRVTVKGSAVPIKLYTFDITNIVPALGEVTFSGGRSMAQFATDDAVQALQKGLHVRFTQTFSAGVQHFLASRWGEAKTSLELAKNMKAGDGPCDTLLNYMRKTDFVPHDDFDGYRVLDSK